MSDVRDARGELSNGTYPGEGEGGVANCEMVWVVTAPM